MRVLLFMLQTKFLDLKSFQRESIFHNARKPALRTWAIEGWTVSCFQLIPWQTSSCLGLLSVPDFLGTTSEWVRAGALAGNMQPHALHLTTACPRPSPRGCTQRGLPAARAFLPGQHRLWTAQGEALRLLSLLQQCLCPVRPRRSPWLRSPWLG